MKRIEWASKMALGWLCYWPVIWFPLTHYRLHMWALSWAGFYAYDTGYADYADMTPNARVQRRDGSAADGTSDCNTLLGGDRKGDL